ncbi:MAG: tetratricopeptide repeat protein [Planctomycetota bacterium]
MSGEPTGWPSIRSLWDYDDPGASEAAFRGLLPRAREAGDLDFELQLLTQVARTYSLRGEPGRAHEILDEIKPRLTTDTLTARVRYLLERGRAFNQDGDAASAQRRFVEAWKQASPHREPTLAGLALDAAHMVAIVAPPEEALAWSRRAIALAEASDVPEVRSWLGPLYHNTGWTHHDRGELDEALAYLEKGLAFRTQAGDPGPIRIARWTIGRCYRSMGRVDEAFDIQRVLAESPEASGYVFEELGELLLLQSNPEDARLHFAKAHAMLHTDPCLARHEPARLQRLAELGGVETGT